VEQYDGDERLREMALEALRIGYEELRPTLDDAGITTADEDEGSPHELFAAHAKFMRMTADEDAPGGGAAGTTAAVYETLAGWARDIGATWAEVRS